jgi:deoxyribonuclease-4
MNVLISNSGLQIGTHVPFEKNLTKTGVFALSFGMFSFQFFMGSPQSSKRTKIDDEDILKFLKLKDRFPINCFTHAPYIYNLAGSKDSLAHEEDVLITINTIKIIKSLEEEINIVSKFGNGVVLHPGCYKDKIKGCKAVSKSISLINFEENGMLILENMSGQGNMLGSTLEELKLIRDNVIEEKQKHIGFCIDTAHIWGMGLYDLSKNEEIDKMFIDLDKVLNLKNIKLFHINDSKVKFNSKVDRHELLCCGEIWKENKGVSLRYILNKIKSLKIPCVLETDVSDIFKFLY